MIKEYLAVVDVESTGLSLVIHEPIQIGIILFDSEYNPIQNFSITWQPYNWDAIDPKSLEVNGLTIEGLKKCQTGMMARNEFIKWWRETAESMRIIPYGWNYKSFDQPMLKKWFGEENYSKIFHYRGYDVDEFIRVLTEDVGLFPELEGQSLKLQNVCSYLNIPLLGHDALFDSRATLEILREGKKRAKNVKDSMRL